MLSCAAPAASALPPAPRARATPPWPPAQLLHAPVIKEEPMEVSEGGGDGGGGAGGGSGFFSEGFHSSSSKDSQGSSPRGTPPHATSPRYYRSPGALQLDFRGALPFTLLTPPGYPAASPERRDPAPPASPASPTSPASDAADSDADEPGLRVPAVNSHGKVKTFKCKQCEFVAVTKLSFWEHTKAHIKPEKMLTCPKCPFVTEYKHHLEYHMRNHFGSKPFQCSQCSYSCVNKSMLNSHLKSHSNVYQYRCADCNYATKYCHSLKLHLRKYRHNPAMVLNHDGTPNPLPIIDVYGTRRGPKQKSLTRAAAGADDAAPQHAPPPPPHALFHNPFAVNFPYGSLLPHPFLFPPNNNYGESSPPAPHLSPVAPHLSPVAPQLSPVAPHLSPVTPHRSPPPAPQRSSPPAPPRTPPPSAPADDALDLTSGKPSEAGSPPAPLTPSALRSRRKGRAFKLQPAALRLQHEDAPLDGDFSGSDSDASAGAAAAAPATELAPAPPAPAAHPAPPAYDCPYCDISFKDLTMHTIHMGYHGYGDPYMCNKCGERSADKVSFYIHLGRAEHA